MTYEAYHLLPNSTSLIEGPDGELLTTVGAVKVLNELTEQRKIATLLRSRVSYGYISQAAVFAFIEDWDRTRKEQQRG